ncbi:autophagy-related 33 protein [Rutstroemia sp. NJR-2017a BBW]|nr:autophagy-related 33 protein [Rutstroemia sp. NJR-2017a BBW]
MTTRSISTLKFVGSISLGLLTGISYTLSSLTIPALLTLPSATVASRSYHSLTTLTTNHIRSLTGISSFAFLLAFYLSPRGQKHPYLLWTSLFAASSSFVDQLVPLISKASPPPRRVAKKSRQSKRQMDASYEVVGDSNSSSADEEGGSFNGEEVRGEMEGEMMRQVVRTVVAGLGFAMSVVGIWGDGVATEVVFVEVV